MLPCQEHPDVAVVENLEDMWKVTKLQQERKARLEEQAAREEMGQLKATGAPPAEVGTLGGCKSTHAALIIEMPTGAIHCATAGWQSRAHTGGGGGCAEAADPQRQGVCRVSRHPCVCQRTCAVIASISYF